MVKYAQLTIALTVLLAMSRPADAETQKFDAVYRAYIAGLPMGDLQLYLTQTKNRYQLTATMQAAGIALLFTDGKAISTTHGRFGPKGFMPKELKLQWQSDGVVKSSSLAYRDGAPVAFNSDYRANKEQQPVGKVDLESVGTDTINPFLALLEQKQKGLLGEICSGTRRIFDGRRLAILKPRLVQIRSQETHDFVVNQPIAECSVKWMPIAGYSKASLERAQTMAPAEFYFATIDGTRFAAPVRIQFETKFGFFSIVAKQFFEATDKPEPKFELARSKD